MAPKRKHEDAQSEEPVHESRQFLVYGKNPKPQKKPRRFEPPTYKKQANPSSVNAIKKRIRDVTRRLGRSDDLSANVRAEDERALAAYQQELADAEGEKIKQKMIKRYHMVRFFERQKATRALKKLRKQVLEAQSTEEVELLKGQMYVAEVDLNYTLYHPLCQPYIGLFPQKDSSANEEDTSKKAEPKPKPPMWAEVEKCMEKGTLAHLRNRAPELPPKVSIPLQARPAKERPPVPEIDMTGMNRRQRRSQRGLKEPKSKNKSMGFAKNEAFGAAQSAKQQEVEAEDGDESDGGFFE